MTPVQTLFWRLARRGGRVAQLLYVTLFWPTLALAAGPEAEGGKRYVNQYAFTVMLIALGIIVLCRPSGREEKVKERYRDV